MNFGDFLDGGNGGGERVLADINFINMPSGAISHPHLLSQAMCSSSGLSLALQTGVEGRNGEINTESNVNGRRSRDEENESRSVSDDISGDELDAADNQPNKKKKRYHRHTPHQIQQLESLFKECPHPDEKQRLDLSRRLCLETRQVKFWFQNRRTQMKTQLERHENSLLRQENDKLRAETMQIREKMRNPMCTNCGGPAIMGDISIEEQHLRIENARLKDELDRVCALAGKFIGRPVASLDISVGQQMSFGCPTDVHSALPFCASDYTGISSPLPAAVTYTRSNINASPMEKSMYLELALSAMNELVKMAEGDELLWIRSLEGGRDVLNYEEYSRTFNPCIGMKPNGFVTEASRESCMVIINSLALVETMMDTSKWQDMFPDLIARTSTADVISNGVGETKSGALHLIHAELQVLSPLVPVREVNFLRFCKQLAEGFWAVVDVSVDAIREISDGSVFPSCRRLPSGFVVQDMPNGHSKVTWVEHTEYDESGVHQLYRPLISSGMGFGSQRWLTALQRRCECLAMLMSSAVSPRDHTAISPGGRKSMLKLAQRMTSNFCAGVCASSIHKWNKLHTNSVDQDVRVMTRKSVDDPGEPPGIVLSAATSVWLPVSPQRLFNFLRDEGLRSEWDILSNGGPMQEMLQIPKGQDHGNCVSLLRTSSMNANQNSMLILQETSIDVSGSLVVYAPVDIPAMHIVMNGGDSAYVAVLPSGFAITPDGPDSHGPTNNGGQPHRVSGSLLTVAFQILVNTLPTAKLNVESVETVNNLISCTVQKIKAALHCES